MPLSPGLLLEVRSSASIPAQKGVTVNFNRRLILCAIAPASLFLVALAFSLWGLMSTQNKFDHYISTEQATADSVNEMYAQGLQMGQALRNVVLDPSNKKAYENFETAEKKYAEAFAKALTLSRDDNLSIERAEVLAQKNGGSFAGEPWVIIQRVLTADPHHLNALFLAGSASYAELNFNTALRYWERAREVVPADSPDAPELDRAIAEARHKMGLPAIPPRAATAAASAPLTQAAMAASSISGRVTLVKELQGLVAPTDTVFVYATPVSGSRMPVAIVRTTADKLPLDFVLDDSSAMTPTAKLSTMSEVTVRVRISKSGQATAQAGDYGVSLTPVKPGSKGLNLMVRDTLQSTAQ